jgi:adenine-specific DNA-methyltransferase
LERETIRINSLDDKSSLPFINSTVLKELKAQGKRFGTLEYLFKFLDAQRFASEGTEDVQEDNRSLINASVLGKVFEKINGYKDGSIFTPAFVTMYMCRQAIRLAVVQKFKDRYGWRIEEFADIKNYLARSGAKDILEFNAVINEIRLCDPAVGSGHFLVSSLNEIIAIKSELGLLADENGVRLSDFEIQIETDELIITDERGDIFQYQINDGKPTPKAQRLQKTLFHEKRTLIENCLFGVDINPNSVKSCRLRLWIELLKNAYYKESGELETLPNIDINIKTGNSLLSRFALDADLKEVLRQVEYGIEDYRNFVRDYKETHNREKKKDFESKIAQIKRDFKVQLNHLSPERR